MIQKKNRYFNKENHNQRNILDPIFMFLEHSFANKVETFTSVIKRVMNDSLNQKILEHNVEKLTRI